MTSKEKCIQKARELAIEYLKNYGGCSHSAFSAVIDALRLEGVELISPEVQNEVFKGLMGLSGGGGNTVIGTCGAVVGASAAVSLAAGVGREEQEKYGKKQRWVSYYNVKTGVVDKFIEQLGTVKCKDIMMKKFGMAYNLNIPFRFEELCTQSEKVGCNNSQSCVVADASAYAVDKIWDMLEKKEDLSWVWEKHEKSLDVIWGEEK